MACFNQVSLLIAPQPYVRSVSEELVHHTTTTRSIDFSVGHESSVQVAGPHTPKSARTIDCAPSMARSPLPCDATLIPAKTYVGSRLSVLPCQALHQGIIDTLRGKTIADYHKTPCMRHRGSAKSRIDLVCAWSLAICEPINGAPFWVHWISTAMLCRRLGLH